MRLSLLISEHILSWFPVFHVMKSVKEWLNITHDRKSLRYIYVPKLIKLNEV